MNEPASRYVRVLHSSLGHPKFIGLSACERGTWVTALVLADIAHPDPVHEAAVLEKCPDATFERLYERELLEQDGRPGWFRVHDLKQFHVAPSQTPEAAAERKRRQREREREQDVTDVTPVTTVTGVTTVTTDETRRDETNRIVPHSRVGRSARPSPTRATGLRPVVER